MAKSTEHTISVPEAGAEYLGISEAASYEAAKRGEIPTIKIGGLLRVPRRAMEIKMEQAGNEALQKRGKL
jgi:excisionase family DNA binding protein